MRYLLDTGILLRGLHRAHAEHNLVRRAVRQLARQHHAFATARQNVMEFWSVCTRPAEVRGGLGLNLIEVQHRLRVIERSILVLNAPPSAYEGWKELVVRHAVLGKQVHDAHLVAIMNVYRIKRILTLNGADFRRYTAIQVVSPHDILSRNDHHA